MPQLFDMHLKAPAFTGYAQVALEQGIDVAPQGLTYGIPAPLSDLELGDRVIVPLGRRNKPTAGYVSRLLATSDVEDIKPITARDPRGVSLTGDLVELAHWMAAYYCCPLGMVFATMLPAAVKRGTGRVLQTQVRLATDASIEGAPLTKLQKSVIESARQFAAEGRPWVEQRRLAERAGARSVAPVKQLVAKAIFSTRTQHTVRADPLALLATQAPAQSIALNADQQRAVDHLSDHLDRGFSVHLLHGVTGSGKTEVYMRAIHRLQQGAIILVPEIALTPQTVERFHREFAAVAVMHSGMTSAQRHVQWRRIREGKARIVVGARSAVFAPIPNLGAIIVDEEHEASYKQDQLPRYHARDVAVRRAQILKVPVVLGSATPSLESYYNATQPRTGDDQTPRYHLLRLPKRVRKRQLPVVQIVDMVLERRQRRGVHLLSRRLETLLTTTLEQRRGAILLLNRRGYANYIACADHGCGWLMGCEFCDAAMVYHKDRSLPLGGLLRCHHCGAEQILPRRCPLCGKRVTVFGLGTQRVTEELEKKFTRARVIRMDSDTMRKSKDYERCLDAFAAGKVDVLVGTQMIAKGLDFPHVRLVGVISADTALHLPDFRASERTFQLIAQVAGRAGRGDDRGIVIVQTFSPNEPVIQLASQYDFETFAAKEIALRRQVGLPPVSRMARIVVRHRDLEKCIAQAETLAQYLGQMNRQQDERVRLLGPMPAPLARVAEFYRQQIEMIAPDAASLQQLLTSLRNRRLLLSDAQTAVDVDPVALM